jgi:hypothetical protein
VFRILNLVFCLILTLVPVSSSANPQQDEGDCISSKIHAALTHHNQYYEIPRIDEKSMSYPPGTARRANDFLDTLSKPITLQGPPASQAIFRDAIPNRGTGFGVILEGGGEHTAELDPTGQTLRLTPSSAATRGGGTYGGIRYHELPNSTLVQTLNPSTGQPRSFLISRGVRYYTTDVDLNTGAISPKNYVSDVLLFEIVNGQAEYRSRLLSSNLELKFLFEDPRISTLNFPDGTRRTFLSGTDYSPHVAGSTNPDVMNRYVELKFDQHGQPLPVETGTDGRPFFSNLSPPPGSRVKGVQVGFVDAKNATIAFNELNQVVVRTRLRPEGEARWKYGEQVFVFQDFHDFQQYDWTHCLEDLSTVKPSGTFVAGDRVRPVVAKELLRDSDIKELYPDPRVLHERGKGMGPGTPPVRAYRKGNELFISDGKNAPDHSVGRVPDNFPLQDGQVTYLTFDHEIRYFKDVRNGNAFTKRHYDLVVKEFDPSLTRIVSYYSSALQPLVHHERGYHSGIADLQHVYPMGREIIRDPSGQTRIRVSLGASDAHTEVVLVDPIQLLMEMAPGSVRRLSGQVYSPGR